MTLLLLILAALMTLLVLIALQGKHTKETAIRLPEASGERLQNSDGKHSVLHIGESTVAGVGVESLHDGLTAQLVQHLQQQRGEPVRWQLLGENGARIGDMLTRDTVLDAPTALIITFGVNDTTKFTRRATWIKNLEQCVKNYAADNTQVFVTAVPPMHRFPLLPAPLKWLLGLKAIQLNNALSATANRHGWCYIGNKIKLTSEYMARDGYHPNRDGYQVWGEWIAEHLDAQLP